MLSTWRPKRNFSSGPSNGGCSSFCSASENGSTSSTTKVWPGAFAALQRRKIALERFQIAKLEHAFETKAARDGRVIVVGGIRQAGIRGRAIDAIGDQKMRQVRQVHLPLDHQHARIHGEGAVAHERPDLQIRLRQRQARREHGGEAHRGIEIKTCHRVARRRPPGLAGIARRGDDDLVGAMARDGAEAFDVVHQWPPRNRSRVNSTTIGRENVRV